MSEQELMQDMEAQAQFLAKEAKARKFQSVKEMLQQEPQTFDLLAQLWRFDHPVEQI